MKEKKQCELSNATRESETTKFFGACVKFIKLLFIQRHMSQQTLLPFVLQGNAVELDPPQDAVPKRAAHKQIEGSRIAATYSIPLKSIPAKDIERHKRALTMVPTDSFNGQGSPAFDAFYLTRDRFHVPRFYGAEMWGEAQENGLREGLPMHVDFAGKLNSIQEEATSTTISHLRKMPHGALLVLPCGYGKTVCALYIAHALGRRTLVLVHKGFLVSQWHERARAFLPQATIGKIQQNVVDADADIVVGMVQSISKRDYPKDVFEQFGTVIIDEAHHMSAPVFSKALHCLPSKHIIGLSATPDRKDGLTKLLHYSMGAIAHRIERKPEHTLVSCMLYEGGKRKEITYRDGRVSLPLMLNALVADPLRNDLIACHIVRYLANDRYVIVLTDRLSQLTDLMKLLIAKGIDASDIAFYIGSTPADERDRASQRRCILSTYSMAKEGLDIPRLDTLIMGTPKGDIVQASGRVQRKHGEKCVPLIVDIVDTFSVFEALRWKRWNFYRKEQFNCQTYAINNDDAAWFD